MMSIYDGRQSLEHAINGKVFDSSDKKIILPQPIDFSELMYQGRFG
jgi:hypothetical protein